MLPGVNLSHNILPWCVSASVIKHISVEKQNKHVLRIHKSAFTLSNVYLQWKNVNLTVEPAKQESTQCVAYALIHNPSGLSLFPSGSATHSQTHICAVGYAGLQRTASWADPNSHVFPCWPCPQHLHAPAPPLLHKAQRCTWCWVISPHPPKLHDYKRE